MIICPKCGNKIYPEEQKCQFCGVKKVNILEASNKKAKEAIKYKQNTQDIVMTNVLPKDVKRLKLLLFSIFLGFAGVHCFYVGRLKRGFLIPLLFLFCITFMFLPETWILYAYLGQSVAGMLGCIACICWWLDIVRIVVNKFEVPVILNNY